MTPFPLQGESDELAVRVEQGDVQAIPREFMEKFWNNEVVQKVFGLRSQFQLHDSTA